MIPSFAALLTAHILADFLFQTDWMARAKGTQNRALLAHIALVALTAWAALGIGPVWLSTGQIDGAASLRALAPVGASTLLHLGMDWIKARKMQAGLRAYLLDQGVHIACAALVAGLWPQAWEQGLWMTHAPELAQPGLALALIGAGLVFATIAGRYAMDMLLAAVDRAPAQAPPKAQSAGDPGLIIGLLERGITYLLVLTGNPAGIGLLVAAKSILRFAETRDDRRAANFVIIGTLGSIGWALATAFAVAALLPALGPQSLATP